MALFDVLNEAGVGGLRARELLGDSARSGRVPAEEVHEHAGEFLSGQRPFTYTAGQRLVPSPM
jgi:hypothetical protein